MGPLNQHKRRTRSRGLHSPQLNEVIGSLGPDEKGHCKLYRNTLCLEGPGEKAVTLRWPGLHTLAHQPEWASVKCFEGWGFETKTPVVGEEGAEG